MTIADNYAPTKDLGNGVTLIFTFSWKALSASYVKVYFEDVTTGVQTEQTTGFVVALSADGIGGTVTFTTEPTSSEYVIIARLVPDTQAIPYKTSSGFQATVVEGSLDKSVAVSQQKGDTIERCLKLPLGTSSSASVPALESGKYLTNDGSSPAWGAVTALGEYAGTFGAGLYADIPTTPVNKDLYFATDTGVIYYCSTNGTWSVYGLAGTASYNLDFDNADLSSGILTVTHGMDTENVMVIVKDSNGEVKYPGKVTVVDSNNVTVALNGYMPLVGDWNVFILSGGATVSTTTLSGAQFSALASIPAGAGIIPAANLPLAVKCTGAEIDTGTDDAKFATPKAIADSTILLESDWTDYSDISTIVGWSSLSTKEIWYKTIGDMVFVEWSLAGTSNSTAVTFTVPFTKQANVSGITYGNATDNGSATGVAAVSLPANSNIVTIQNGATATAWTNSGAKATTGAFWYHKA